MSEQFELPLERLDQVHIDRIPTLLSSALGGVHCSIKNQEDSKVEIYTLGGGVGCTLVLDPYSGKITIENVTDSFTSGEDKTSYNEVPQRVIESGEEIAATRKGALEEMYKELRNPSVLEDDTE